MPPLTSSGPGFSNIFSSSEHSLFDSSQPIPSSLAHSPSNHLTQSASSKKRKRTTSIKSVIPETIEKPHAISGFIGIQPPPLIYPKCLYLGHKSQLPLSRETPVLEDILDAEDNRSQFSADDFISIDLEDFCIYRPQKTGLQQANQISEPGLTEKPKSNELVSLHQLNTTGNHFFQLDGILRFGQIEQHRRRVHRVTFANLSIGRYEDETLHTVGSDIWLQSFAGKASNVWYRLTQPAPEYLRYHEPFIWLADLAKHVIDYLHAHKQSKVRLRDFKSTFSSWLQAVHCTDQDFWRWFHHHPSRDFRHIVAAHASFLYNQAAQLNLHYTSHDLWGEIDPAALNAILGQPGHRQDDRTVVTPYVYQCFSHMPWAKALDPISPITDRGQPLPNQNLRVTSHGGTVQIGDIVALSSDPNTAWKTKDEHWYAYVQGLQPSKRGNRLSLLWIYRPADTACQDMKYPYDSELFLSDHCNCEDAPVYDTDVARKVPVVLFGHPDDRDCAADFFVRQKYNSADSYWTTLRFSDFHCRCNEVEEPVVNEFLVGDTLLVKASSPKEVLEPVVLVGHTSDVATIHVRRLLRKRDDYGDLDADPNELVFSSRIDVCDSSMIVRRCRVRFYTSEDQKASRIPAPYNRNGTGDCYYVISAEHDPGHLEAINHPWPVMNQGFDPKAAATPKPMRGLDIFCGGGSFGRGLEEGGAVQMEWAVDNCNEAIHTYHANADEACKIYNGSVNDYLSDAIHHRRDTIVAQQGEVAFICAGNPCQGFSTANNQKQNDRSLRNISLVASVVAYVDFYRPEYLLMENVLGMANCGGKSKSNVFAQVLCALVGLGYQVRPMLLDSWNFGAPQSRSRLFIAAAAPGLKPLQIPAASHSHPDSVISRSLGKTANGLPFGAREWMPTPFEYITIGEATHDLPVNTDGRAACVAYPDHRITRAFNTLDNVRLSCIPRFPPGMTFVKSARLGWQPPPQIATWHWDTDLRASTKSKAWQRARSNALLPTVTTANSPNEALTGSALHWDAHRQLTVMEARRAQGFPDGEVIIGAPAQQWKIIGNSVTRQVAIALGLKLREAWLGNRLEGTVQDGDMSEDELIISTSTSQAARRLLDSTTAEQSTTTGQTTPGGGGGGSSDPIEISSHETSVTTV
ncbi:MAG: hypothetical protein LQ341_005451 [Variospora aurantia]|nr:MAG: hypothetical protein LQ341_005451 [Variospora aurantia]